MHMTESPPPNRTWLPMELSNGPCSSSLVSGTPSMTDLLHKDQLRADDVQRRLSKNGTGDEDLEAAPTSESNSYGDNKIAVGVGSRPKPAGSSNMQEQEVMGGTIHPAATGGGGNAGDLVPGVVQTMVLDTASDVPWVQCSPCPVPACHPQPDTLYDPSMSGTYAAFPCNSPACARLGPYANGCVNNQCQYRVAYPDGSSTSGTYISDLLTLNPTSSINGFQFGCSHADRGNFDPSAAGIMALGGGPESLAAQAAPIYGSLFSYCIPPSSSYLGFFVLGGPLAAPSRYVSTPLIRDGRAPATFYRVLLRGVTVAGQQLNAPAAVYVLDSRTTITRMPPTAYRALRAAFVGGMTMYRRAAPKGILDTCYDFSGVRSVKLPKITLLFAGTNAAVELDPSGILFNDCLAFAANRDDTMPGILGSVQQKTIEVLYHVGAGAVAFRRNAC